MKKGKRVKPKFPIEYRLLITPRFKDREKVIVTHVELRTVNEFTSFHYEIVVKPDLAGTVLRLNIHGLRAPQVSLPGSGPATFAIEYPNLKGHYTVIVSKLDHEENTFFVDISPGGVIVKKSPQSKFVDVVM